jgi:hypothetical protein
LGDAFDAGFTMPEKNFRPKLELMGWFAAACAVRVPRPAESISEA